MNYEKHAVKTLSFHGSQYMYMSFTTVFTQDIAWTFDIP